jgi:tight adherence protein B
LRFAGAPFGDAKITVKLATPTTTLQTSTDVPFPAAPAAPVAEPVTAPTIVTSPTVTAALSLPPAVAPPRTAPISPGLLIVGGALLFVALAIFGLLVLPRSLSGRASKRQLGLSTLDMPSLTDARGRVVDATDRALKRSAKSTKLTAALDTAGLSVRPGEFVLLILVAAIVGFLAGLAFGGPVGALGMVGLVALMSFGIVDLRIHRRRAAFAESIPEVLQMITSGLRSGYGLMQAIDSMHEDAPEPARALFHQVLVETRLGRDPADSLRSVSDKMASSDFAWIVSAVDIHKEVGGNLAEVFENVGATVRERQKLIRHISGLTAEGRLSAYILTALPVLVAVVMRSMNPTYFDEFNTAGGRIALIAAAGMIVVGWVWMRKMLKLTV